MNKDKWFTELAGKEVGKYVLESYVGGGNIGHVYQGYSKETPEWKLAIKIIPDQPKDGWKVEITKASRLSGIPGVVSYHDLGDAHLTHSERTLVFLYTVWDFIPPGRNLNQYLAQINTCSTSFLIAVVEQILRVLHACQVRGVKRHGDLHAGNILIGEKDEADLDYSPNLNAREPVYVSDFGYGATGGGKLPKDDYVGLAEIVGAILDKVEWDKATTTDRQIIKGVQELINKLLKEQSESERRPPKEILKAVIDLDQRTRAAGGFRPAYTLAGVSGTGERTIDQAMSVGQFQVSEMLGDDWERWKRLFVSAVPAKSRILEPDASTVVTGPRGCGKTMLFRRLSERLAVECGPIEGGMGLSNFVAFYINANDIADAFSTFQNNARRENSERLVCYANLSVLSDLLSVQSARSAKFGEEPTEELLTSLQEWLVEEDARPLIIGENQLENYRSYLERIKWKFPKDELGPLFPAFTDFSQHKWLPKFIEMARRLCPWIGSKQVFLFIDDYTTPRISVQMQKILNRLLFQRSNEFVCKVATESATTFVPEDSSGKVLQDGDDYQLIDMGEESLFMNDDERSQFLDEIFKRRLSLDPRIPETARNLKGLLGNLGIKKLEFARRLRQRSSDSRLAPEPVPTGSQRRGATRARVLYHGCEVFTDLWSGDTRTMIQLVQELVDAATNSSGVTKVPVQADIQDRVLRNRGGQWLEAQTRNQPTSPKSFKRGLSAQVKIDPVYRLTGGSYGSHLKAIVEAFVKVARQLLLSPMYKIKSGTTQNIREVPRMAFRIEVNDEFRIEGLAEEIYKDLIRYGMFMRDARGKSVRGAFVPRLYLRRLLLPYATLALSKRDSVPMECQWFKRLLLYPDSFNEAFNRYIEPTLQIDIEPAQLSLLETGSSIAGRYQPDPVYDDIDPEELDLDDNTPSE